MSKWQYYFPDGGETADDAREIKHSWRKPNNFYDAAQIACELDFARHDGWERGDARFQIAVISPEGEEHRYEAWHEPSVEHRVSETT